MPDLRVLGREDSARHRSLARDRQGDRDRARRRRSERRRRLPLRAGRGGGARRRDRRSRDPGRHLECGGRASPRRRGGRPRHPRQQRRPHSRRVARAHVGRRLADRPRDQSLVRLLHVPCGHAADDEEARRLDRQHLIRRGGPRQLGPDELRGVEGGDHRLHQVAGARARLAQRARERRRAGLHPDAAHRGVAGGGDRGDADRTRPSAGSGEPEDVAGAVRFLCSDAASFITGEVLLVDGGLGM